MEKPLINPSEALSILNAIIIDARGGADGYQRYLKAHAENALYVDLDLDLSQKPLDAAYGGRHPLPDIKNFGALLGKLGITPSTHVLVYDDKAGANAASRFWWMMKAIGHQNIQVIDGGLDAMMREGISMTNKIHEPIGVNPYPVTIWQLPTADIETVSHVGSDPNYVVIDVREGYRYRGESEPIDLVAGHIPGAINIPYMDNLNSDGKFLSSSELAEKYKQIIKVKPEYVIVHCGSGVTACHTLLAMEQAGIKGAKLYVGSWGEWSRRNMPIVVESASKNP
jgi:thiosulfate/3-mercaptopyruvate sulfurtransferase